MQSVYFGGSNIRLFQDMLESLTGLKILSLLDVDSAALEQKIILPRSLEVLSLADIGEHICHAIGSGMEASTKPSSLKTIIMDYGDAAAVSRSFWEAVGSETQVVLELSLIPMGIPEMTSQNKVVFSCFQHHETIEFFSAVIPRLPENVDEIYIDFNPSSASIDHEFDLPGGKSKQAWINLDDVLKKRHQLGMLKHLYFRCTKRDDLCCMGGSLRRTTGSANRAILGQLGSLLPRSMAEIISFIEIDTDTMYF
ncbi:hypothetical protein D9757_007682 [Collybiopsis confluens]|nr:hypothetical protein D9757_007682 [Collybiopsis confluens]